MSLQFKNKKEFISYVNKLGEDKGILYIAVDGIKDELLPLILSGSFVAKKGKQNCFPISV